MTDLLAPPKYAMSPAGISAGQVMNRDEIETLLRAAYKARQDNDVEAAVRCFHSQGEFRIVGSDALKPFTQPVSGHDELRAMFAAMFPEWDWTDFKPQNIHIDGNTAFVLSVGEMKHVPSGRSFSTEILDRVVIRDDLIASFTEFLDTHLVTQILGPPAP